MKPLVRPHQVAAAILAAGASSRMGSSKALLRLDGVPFLERIARLYAELEIPAVAILGGDAEEVRSAVDSHGARFMVNPRPEEGPLSSLLLALGGLREASALLVHPVDHPLVAAETVRSLAVLHRRVPSCILIPSHRGAKGHPTLFPRRFFGDLRAAPLDEGARWAVRRNRASTLLVSVEDPGVLANLNTPEDLRRFGVRAAADEPTRWDRKRNFAECPPDFASGRGFGHNR